MISPKTGRVYNVIPDTPDPRDLVAAFPNAEQLALAPDEVDFREIPERVPPVWDQGQEGACTGHGNGAAFEIHRREQKLTPMMPSRKFIYRAERKIEGDVAQDNGAQVRTGIKAMATVGVPHEELYPYTVDDFTTEPAPDVYADALKHKVEKYMRVAATPEGFVAALAGGDAVVFGFTVYDSFEGEEVAKTGVLPMPASGEKNLGGHCVCAVGYKITSRSGKHGGVLGPILDHLFGAKQLDGYLIVRNSWGDTWGDKGYFQMPFGYLRHGYVSDAWVVQAVDNA